MYNGTLMLADEDGNTEEDEEKTSLFEKIQASFPLLMAWLYKRRSFSYEDMTADEVQKFVGEVSEYYNHAVDTAIRQVPMAEVSVQRLKESNYVFSGIKVFHELNEAFPSLVDENNEIRPFKDFLNDVQKINNTYNGSYLRTEYNFAYQSSLMASRWKQFEEDGDRYNLQYRTAYDDRVRTSHRKLEGITLPPSSKFWNDYFPPNGWNCRCTVVQVRKDKYPESNEQEAMNLGSQATAGKHQEMFKFNPGKAMTTFPAYNAYTISKCKNCKMNGALKLVADIPDNELCGACKVMKEVRKLSAKVAKEKAQFLKNKKINHPVFGKEINITGGCIKEWTNQPFKHYFEKNRLLLNIEKVLEQSEYLGPIPSHKDENITSHIFQINIEGDDAWIIVREYKWGEVNLHSISDGLADVLKKYNLYKKEK